MSLTLATLPDHSVPTDAQRRRVLDLARTQCPALSYNATLEILKTPDLRCLVQICAFYAGSEDRAVRILK